MNATDVIMDNVTVILLSGTHELYGSLSVKDISNFTLFGVSGEHPVEVKCRDHVFLCSLEFVGVHNLTITRIVFSQCGDFETLPQKWRGARGVLIFIDVFNLKMTWVVIRNGTTDAICAVNVFGNSLIDHSNIETDFEALQLDMASRTQNLLKPLTPCTVIVFIYIMITSVSLITRINLVTKFYPCY